MEKNKTVVIVDWYNEKKGFGIARNNGIPMLLHSSYLNNRADVPKTEDIISCIPVEFNNILHATEIELVNKMDKDLEKIINKSTKI